ncbi:MAG: hypothetical protein WBC44_21680 [Planctomycetaceae bacterium]
MDVRTPAIATGLLCVMAVPAVAAPFVAGDPVSLSARISDSRAAVIVRPVDAADPGSGWTVVAVLHDGTGAVSVGQTLQPRPAPATGTDLALLLSNRNRTVVSISISDEAAAYVQSLPAADAAGEKRLQHALRHLDHGEPLIAGDAFAVLSSFTAADFDRHRRLLPRDRLVELIEDDETPGDRIALSGYLLGLCGTAEDAKRLRRRLLTCEGFATGADGVAAGYLMLTGEEGLADLETHVLMTENTPPLVAGAVLEAVRFLRSQPNGPFSAERLRLAACCGLVRHDVADLAVGHLAAAKEWDALSEVATLLNATDPNADRGRAGQVAAVRFLLECRRDTDASPDLRTTAARLLDEIAVTDADLIRRATHLSGMPPRRH